MDKKAIWKKVWRFFRPVLLLVVAALIGVGVSFFFYGPFSFRIYSDRLFWVGIGAIILGGFVIFASLGAYRTLGTPSILTASSDARIAHERVGEYISTNAKRYSFVFQMFAVAILCIALSALIELVSR